MYSTNLHKALARERLLKIVLWSALTFSAALFGLVPRFITLADPGYPPDAQHIQLLSIVFSVMALVIAATSLGIRKFFSSERGLEIAMKQARIAPLPEIDTARLRELEIRFIPYFRAQSLPLIISLAMHESIAILGLVLALMERNPDSVFPFAAGAVILNLFIFPNPQKIYDQAVPYLQKQITTVRIQSTN